MGAIFFDQKKSLLNGELIRALIRRKKLRQYQVARKVRVSSASFTQLLNREYKADPVLILSIAQVLGVSPNLLLTEPAPIPLQEVRHVS